MYIYMYMNLASHQVRNWRNKMDKGKYGGC